MLVRSCVSRPSNQHALWHFRSANKLVHTKNDKRVVLVTPISAGHGRAAVVGFQWWWWGMAAQPPSSSRYYCDTWWTQIFQSIFVDFFCFFVKHDIHHI